MTRTDFLYKGKSELLRNADILVAPRINRNSVQKRYRRPIIGRFVIE